MCIAAVNVFDSIPLLLSEYIQLVISEILWIIINK